MNEIISRKGMLILLFPAICRLTYCHDAETGFPTSGGREINSISASLSSRYESRYYAEGRDSLDGDGIWINSVELGYGAFTGALWYGDSPRQDYDELQFSLAVTRTVGKVELSLGFTQLEFLYENTSDQEIGFAMSVPGLPLDTEFGADIYYSFDAGGYFAELALGREILANEHLNLTLVGLFGINQGYVADGHDGANHLALSLQLDIPLRDQLVLNLHTTYSWAINSNPGNDGDLQLIDFFHGNIGLAWVF